MGTRSTVTLITQKRTIKYYIHFDGYLSGVGKSLVVNIKELFRRYTLEEIIKMIDSMIDITDKIDEEKISEDMLIYFAPYYDHYEFINSPMDLSSDWSYVLNRTQLSLVATISCGYFRNWNQQEEFNYVLDFTKNTFSSDQSSLKFPLDNIPIDWIKKTIATP